jgi:tRNA pseudouridine55 synthase
VARTPRQITVYDLKRLSDVIDGRAELEIECSKGTYVRTLCADIGVALGCGGAMAALRRVRSGAFSVEQAYTIEQLQSLAEQGRIEEVLLPAESLLADAPVYITSEAPARACRNGAPVPAEAAPGRYRVRSGSGSFLMLGRCADGEMRAIKNFF